MCIYKYWNIRDRKPINTAYLLVLSYGVRDGVTPNKPTKSVIKLAYRWWKKNPDAKVILSTGDNQGLGKTNAQVMTDYAERIGIPRRNIIKEDKSQSTYENLLFSKRIFGKENFKNPTLMTYDLHMRRGLATARKLGWRNLYHLSSYSSGEPSFGKKYLQTYSRLTILIYEMLAYVYSKVVGWI